MADVSRAEIIEGFRQLQDRICQALEKADGKARFQEELWQRGPEGGGGRTRVIQNGAVLAKGGVNFSAVHGLLPDNIVKALGVSDNRFLATGVSIVLHPESPEVPIIHMNVRYFELEDGTWWFGGGIDLTPIYVNEVQATEFHKRLKAVCDQAHPDYYARFKVWADDYFYIKHRHETRGVGGIFFDRLNGTEEDKARLWDFVIEVGNTFAPFYTWVMGQNRDLPYGEAETYWQSLRRSRYVEFNLVYDKGTKFGLDTDGRTESILMSMPPVACWPYNFQPEAGSREAQTQAYLVKGYDWLA